MEYAHILKCYCFILLFLLSKKCTLSLKIYEHSYLLLIFFIVEQIANVKFNNALSNKIARYNFLEEYYLSLTYIRHKPQVVNMFINAIKIYRLNTE